MELQGMTASEVDEIIAVFAAMMHAEAMHACDEAAELMIVSNDVVVASPIDSLSAIVSAWNTSVKMKLMPYLKNVFVKAGKTVASPLGVTAATSPVNVLDDVQTSLTHYANDLYDAGHLAVMVGWQDGATVMVMADSLETVPDAKAAKAHSVATTLVTATVNGGEWSQMQAIASKFGAITTKEWVATHDSHTRPTHWAADGQVVPLAQKFVVGNTLLDFPGDPFGDLDEIINCRCTTKYDADIQVPNSTSQTSPGALSADSAVDTTEQILASAATNPNWKSSDHPRGKNGRFIKKGVGLPTNVFTTLTAVQGGESFKNMSGSDQQKFVYEIEDITPEQWANLKDDQKLTIETAVNDAIDLNVQDAHIAQTHIDELSIGDADSFDEPDLFDPNTPLPNTGAPSLTDKGSVIMDVHDAHAAGKISDEQKKTLLEMAKNDNFSAEDLQEILDDDIVNNATSFKAKEDVQAKIDAALDAGEITQFEHATLTEFLQDDTAPPAMIEKQLNNVKKTVFTPSSANDDEDDDFDSLLEDEAKNKELISNKISQALADGKITQAQHDNLMAGVNGGADLENVDDTLESYIDTSSSSSSSTLITTGSPKPLKITHGLIHAKHAPGTTIAVGDNGDRITWNGSSYDITDADGNELHKDVKKSKLYALLNGSYYGGVNWNEPGNQPVAVTHVAPLDAAPPANPIPHPVSFPVPSAVDTALDDAFGPMNTGVATPSSPSTPSVSQGLDMTGWVQVGGQAGSNKGALFEAPDGKRYYVKSLKSKEHAQNEVLAAALYRAAGINVPEVRHVSAGAPPGWSNVIASPIVPNAKSNKTGLTKPGKFKEQAQQTYAVTAWLANFDAVGLTHDNMIESDGQVHLIDVGGSMAYRAQGSKKKPGDWNEDPSGALSGLMDPNVNPQAASVYGGMTYEQQRESAKALLGITDAQIDQMVKDAGLPPKQAAILKARRDAILKKYGLDKNNASTSNAPTATMAPTNSPTVTGTPAPDPIAALLDAHATTPIVITPMTAVPDVSTNEPDLDSTAKMLSLGVLPNGTPNEIIISLNKLHEAGQLSDKDFIDLVEGVQSGKVFMGKMVVGMHNTKVQAANYTVPDAPSATPISTSNMDLTPDMSQHDAVENKISQAFVDGHITTEEYDNLISQLDNINPDEVDALDALAAKVDDAAGVMPGIVMPGSPITVNEIINNTGQFAVGEVIATGVDTDGYQWTVSHAPGGYVYVEVKSPSGFNTGGIQMHSYPSLIDTTNDENISWTASDGSTSLLPGPSVAKKAAKKVPAKKVAKVVSPPPPPPSTALPSGDEVAAVQALQSLLDDDNDPTHAEVLSAVENMTQAQFDKLASWHKGNLNAYIQNAVTDDAPGAKFAAAKFAALKSGFGDDFGDGPDDLLPGVLPPSKAMPAPASSAPAVNTADIPGSKKYDFYQNFKAENVSPAWSAAKIYKSMQAAKLKMAGDHQIAALTDEQMLEILDQQHEDAKGLAPGSQAYSAKVKAWLKTPAGQKVFAQLNPNIATPPSGVAKKMTNPFSKAAAAKAAKATPVTVDDSSAGGTSTSSPLSDAAKTEVFGKFKAATHGKYLKDSPAEIYWNAVQQAKLQGTTAGAILKAVDEEGAKNLGVANAGLFHKKVNDWIKTPSGQAKAKEIKAGTWSPGTTPAKKVGAKKVSPYSGGYGSSISGGHTYAASAPLSDKVQDVSGTVPPFDNNKSAADFPVISNSQAATLWDDMVAQSGQPFQPKQKASLKYYTTNPGFKAMNPYLRGQSGATEATHTHVANAQAGMRPTTRDIVLHRGQGSFTDGAGRHWGSYDEISQYVGTNLHQQAFFSASVGGHADFGGSIMMEIEVPAGTPAAYVKAFSAYKNSESEMLLAADLEYRIMKVEKKGYQTVVRMRVVPKGSA